MTEDFRVGDKVRHRANGCCGTVTDFVDGNTVKVEFAGSEVFAVWNVGDCEIAEG